MTVISWNYVASGINFCCSAMFQGLGNTMPALLSSGSRLLTFVAPLLWMSSVLAEGLARRGHEAHFLTAAGPVPTRLRALGHEVVELGERAFEIVLARRVAAGKEATNWFERHGSTPTTEIPARWPETYRRVPQRRIVVLERDPRLRNLAQWTDQGRRT